MNKLWANSKRAFRLVPIHFQGRVRWCLALSLFNGILDIISLAALIPVILIFLNPGGLDTRPTVFTLYERLSFSDEFSFRITALSALVLLFIIKNVMSIWVNHYVSTTVFDISTALSKVSLKNFFNQTYLEFTQSNSAIVSRKIKTIPHDFANYILLPQLNIVTECIVACTIITAICFYHPIICLLLVIVMLPILFAWKWFKRQHLEKVENDFKNKYPASLKFLLQGVDSYIDVKLYQKEDFFVEKFIGIKREMNRNYAYLKTASFLPPKLLEVILIICIALIFSYSAFFGLETSLIPLLSLFVAGFYRLYPSITRITNGLTTINAYSYVLDEFKTTTLSNTHGLAEEISFGQKIRFDQVSFSYPGKDTLFRKLDIELYRGQCIGIHGASGSGKTTLVKLLTGLITPDSGQVIIDDLPLTPCQKNSWLSKIGYLQQQPVIIDASLEENIAFGEQGIDHDKLRQAIREASLEEFVASLPNGLSTHLGENGLQISGGQRQRIALARALYRDSELFIFDEVSNNLDKTNQLEIRNSIISLLAAGKTVLLIDHEPGLLQITDRILEIAAGDVYEAEVNLI